jgi:hypothetical protein
MLRQRVALWRFVRIVTSPCRCWYAEKSCGVAAIFRATENTLTFKISGKTMTEKYPIHDVYLNTKTHCTIDEAVGMLLNLVYLPKEFIQMSDEEIYNHDFDNEPVWSLQEILAESRTDLVNEYVVAKHENMSDDVLEEKLQAIKDFDNDYIKKARAYLLNITDEIAKGTLRVDEHNNITLQSLHESAVKNHKLSILEVSVAGTAGVTPRKQTIPKEERGLSKTLKENFYLTFVCLLKAFVGKPPSGKYGKVETTYVNGVEKKSVGSINIQAIADYLSTLVPQSDESIKGRIEEAIKDVEKRYPDIFEKTVEEKK